MNIQEHNRFVISQRFTPLVNRFDIYDSANELIGFAEQKRFNLREKISIWQSDDKDKVLFSISAEKVFDIHGKYLVLDDSGQGIGYLRKFFGASLLRSTWGAYDQSGKLVFKAKEKNLVFALVRRIGGLLPVIGELLEQLPFNFVLESEDKIVGYHRRMFGIRDKYEICLTEDIEAIDKRVLIALGLLLDILQQR